VIKGFGCAETERVFRGQFSKKLPQEIQRKAAAKLNMIHAATRLATLRVPPGNRLEALAGTRAGNTVFESTTSGASALSGEMAMLTTSRSWTITRGDNMARRDFPPVHPGEILKEEFLAPLGISEYRLAKDIGVTPRHINEIVHGRRGITADTALRLGRFFNMEAVFWMNLQTRYDMEVAEEALGDRLDKEVHPHARAA